MSIIQEIQTELLSANADLSTILLKMRFLASRLGSEPLEDWVRYEAEGYPRGVEVPSYRIVDVSYKGTWSGPWGSGIQNAPIPGYLIEKHAGEDWTRHKVRESIAGIEALTEKKDGTLGIDASNLILLLQGKIYEEWACNSVSGEISVVSMREIKQSVRSRILELTINLEKRVPEAVDVTLQKPISSSPTSNTVNQIFNQTVYGNVNHITATDGAQINLAIIAGDADSIVKGLTEVGITKDDAKTFAEIVSSEAPGDDKQVGNKTLDWIKKNASKAGTDAWKIGSSVVTDVLTEAALRYYGLKS